MKKIVLITVATLIFSATILSAAGETALDFMRINVGARPAGMGEAFVAVADETSAMYWNPAGLGFMKSTELQGMYSSWIGDVSYGYLGFATPTKDGTFGAGVQYVTTPDTPRLSNGQKIGEFSYHDLALTLPYASKMSEDFALGVNLKIIESVISDNRLNALTWDFGALYKTPVDGLSVGLAGQNLFGKAGEDRLPITIRVGSAYAPPLFSFASDFLISAELGKAEKNPGYYAIGVENWWSNIIGVRCGYKCYTDEKQNLSMDPMTRLRAGITIRIQELSVDYAIAPFDSLGDAHRISLTYRVGGWWGSFTRRVKVQISAEPPIFSPNGDGNKDTIVFKTNVKGIKNADKWELYIRDVDFNFINGFSGFDTVPKELVWNGFDTNGAKVADGVYSYKFSVVGEGSEKGISQSGEVTIDFAPPTFNFSKTTDKIYPANIVYVSSVIFSVNAKDNVAFGKCKIEIKNEKGALVKTFESLKANEQFVWYGREEKKDILLSTGVYIAELSVFDDAGNKASTHTQISILKKAVDVDDKITGTRIILPEKLVFIGDSTRISENGKYELNKVVDMFNGRMVNYGVIEGHTSSGDDRDKEMRASGFRALAVYNYLVKVKGVSKSKIRKVSGIGPDRPVSSNQTEDGRDKNNRIEIIIIKNVIDY